MSDFAPADQRRANCYVCGVGKRVDTLFEKTISWSDRYGIDAGTDEFFVFQCRGCEAVFLCKSSVSNDDRDEYYDERGEVVVEFPWTNRYLPEMPKLSGPRLPHMQLSFKDSKTAKLLSDVYTAIDHDLYILAVIGARTTFDRASEFLGIDPNETFENKLELLRKGGFISGKEKGDLEVLIDAGGAAAHRGWEPDRQLMTRLVQILNDFISRNMLRANDAKKIRDKLPKKNANLI